MGAHDFDFWIGDWDVVGPLGKHVGSNSITRDGLVRRVVPAPYHLTGTTRQAFGLRAL